MLLKSEGRDATWAETGLAQAAIALSGVRPVIAVTVSYAMVGPRRLRDAAVEHLGHVAVAEAIASEDVGTARVVKGF